MGRRRVLEHRRIVGRNPANGARCTDARDTEATPPDAALAGADNRILPCRSRSMDRSGGISRRSNPYRECRWRMEERDREDSRGPIGVGKASLMVAGLPA